jgi:hypothetical protein
VEVEWIVDDDDDDECEADGRLKYTAMMDG